MTKNLVGCAKIQGKVEILGYNLLMEFVELERKEFEGLDFACGSFLQSAEMYQRYHDLGREAYLVGVKNKNQEIVAAGLILGRNWHFGKKIFRVPGGWLMNYDGADRGQILEEITQGAREFCRERQGIMLEISPNIVNRPRDMNNEIVQGRGYAEVKNELALLGYKYLGEYEQAKWLFVLDLKGCEPEALFASFRTTHRQLIRKAERDGVRVRELDMDELGVLKEIAEEAGTRHGFQDPELVYYRSMKKAFGKKVKFVVAEIPRSVIEKASGSLDANEEGKDKSLMVPLAAAMFINNGREMVYLYSGSLRKWQKYNGSYAIQWHMIQEAIKSGCQRYNFYGTRPVAGDGVYLFKQGFRGNVEELLGTFALPIGVLGKLYLSRIKVREIGAVQ